MKRLAKGAAEKERKKMTKYVVSFSNAQGAWLEDVTVETKSQDKKYIANLAKKESIYSIDRGCGYRINRIWDTEDGEFGEEI